MGGWGYQLERSRAGTALALYTLGGSLPLLLFIIIAGGYSRVGLHGAGAGAMGGASVVLGLPIIAFLVKLPMVGLHMWLPKAHVEAPVVGSIFLAAVLLKLGGYGALALQDLAAAGAISSVLIGVSLAGAVGVAGLCCQSLDLKVLIAYTSVGHMALVVLGVSLHTSLGFYLAFILYINTGSRRVVLNKATLGASGLLVGLSTFILLALIGCPPALNV